nr:glutamate synthase 1 [NADH], chloroplastic isoform X2 [Tanacetum cinerariifolium]
DVKNTDRTIGTLLSNEIAKRYHAAGLPDDTIRYKFIGSAGQSFGAFSSKGLTFKLEGEANDYVGKGLSGARLAIFPPATSTWSLREGVPAGVQARAGEGGEGGVGLFCCPGVAPPGPLSFSERGSLATFFSFKKAMEISAIDQE